ncbi:MAG TPA: ribosome maturation factor RimP [Terriglobales bacterium]|nr:ribosome maturation factor RimP [Terriglobales bacterium]
MALDLEQVRRVAERVTASSGLELVDLEFLGGGKARMLRLFIDKPGGVTHQDCESVSREVGTILDMEDLIPGDSYLLEVSSPGLDRKLSKPADYERFKGSLIKVTTYEPVEGNRNFRGRLNEFADGRVTLELETAGSKKAKKKQKEQVAGTKVTIELKNVAKANLVPEI